jgi:DNA-directed RNA polymerase subunit RPC12/RpoP
MANIKLVMETNNTLVHSVYLTGDSSITEQAFFDLAMSLIKQLNPNKSKKDEQQGHNCAIECSTNTNNVEVAVSKALDKNRPQQTSTQSVNNNINNSSTVNHKKTLVDGKQALIGTTCPRCGGLYIGVAEKGSAVTCKHCSSEFKLTDEYIRTEYECPNCDTYMVMYTSDEITEIACKQCQSPIDLFYIDKLGKKVNK